MPAPSTPPAFLSPEDGSVPPPSNKRRESVASALPAATAPLAAWVARETWRLEVGDAGFNGTLSAAAALHLLFGSALALGLALDGVAWRD